MKRFVIAAITCIALTVGVSPAAADGGLGGVVETITGTTQQNTNTAGDASASNANGTWQSNDQSQQGYGGDASTGDASTGTSGDAYGGDVTQSQEATNTNATSQEASAESKAEQTLPVNVAVPICVAKACDMGSAEQSNTNSSGDVWAGNTNTTGQSNEQSQKGVGGDATTGDATTGGGSGDATTGDAHGGDVTQSQTASNSNETTQNATAASKAKQTVPVNAYVPVCIAYKCETGDVSQSNANRSGDASASNQNGTWQSNDQSQKGVGGDATTGDATAGGNSCDSCHASGDATSGKAYGGDVTQSQSASNANSTSQDATATSKAKQVAPVNAYVPVCLALYCRSGDVEQSNTNGSGDAWAGNVNKTGQSNEQSQSGVGGDAASGDATATGGCCKPEPECKQGHAYGKTYGKEGCKDGKPEQRQHGADAESGKAVGGDVDQRQQASNDNRTSQTAYAKSKATQKWASNVGLFSFPWQPGPTGCKSC
jgi:hypothetical protein